MARLAWLLLCTVGAVVWVWNGHSGGALTYDQAITVLSSPDASNDQRAVAVVMLRRHTSTALALLRELLADSDEKVRRLAREALQQLGQ